MLWRNSGGRILFLFGCLLHLCGQYGHGLQINEKCYLEIPRNGTINPDIIRVADNRSYIYDGEWVTLTCDDGYDILHRGTVLSSFSTRCRGSFLTKAMPACTDRRCILPDRDHASFTTPANLTIRETHVPHLRKINITCDTGFTPNNSLHQADCLNGLWNPQLPECIQNEMFNTAESQVTVELYDDIADLDCGVPDNAKYWYIHGETGDYLTFGDEIRSGQEVNVLCRDMTYTDNDSNAETTITCKDGVFSNITPDCPERHCGVPDNSKYWFMNAESGESLDAGDEIRSGQEVNVTCQELTYDYYSSSDTTITCKDGVFTNINLVCPELHCKVPDNAKYWFMNAESGDNLNTGDEIKSDQKVTVTCRELTYDYYSSSDVTITCKDGVFTNINLDCPEWHCNVPDNAKYWFMNAESGDYLNADDEIRSDQKVNITCRALTYDYDSNTDVTITCKDGVFTNITVDCPEPEDTTGTCEDSVRNGRISNRYFDLFEVICDDGYTLNLFPFDQILICKDNKLTSEKYNRVPECKPDDCVLPDDLDGHVSVWYNQRGTHDITLSARSIVEHNQNVIIDCPEGFEPQMRRFKCKAGNWTADDRGWTMESNRSLPTCRQTICEPECQNQGKCVRDGRCKCKPGTKGNRCEIFVCDKACVLNDGECTAPAFCECKENRHGRNCEFLACTKPETNATIANEKKWYKDADTPTLTCPDSMSLSDPDPLTCSPENGTWSRTVLCIPVFGKSCSKMDDCGGIKTLRCHEQRCVCNSDSKLLNGKCQKIIGSACVTANDCPMEFSYCYKPYPHRAGTCKCSNCKTSYSIVIKTANKRWAGTDANVLINLYGDSGKTTGNKQIDGKFERNVIDTFQISLEDIGRIRDVVFTLGSDWITDKWLPSWASIYTQSRHEHCIIWQWDNQQKWLDNDASSRLLNSGDIDYFEEGVKVEYSERPTPIWEANEHYCLVRCAKMKGDCKVALYDKTRQQCYVIKNITQSAIKDRKDDSNWKTFFYKKAEQTVNI